MASGRNVRIEDLEKLQKNLESASEYMSREIRHEDIAIFIGSTRSGKSSLINYLLDNPLIGESIGLIGRVIIAKADKSKGPEIGLSSTSETKIPTRWESNKIPKLTIWDAPGFDDNRGPIQDIVNAFYINELLKNIKSAKFVLVVDINEIAGDNIKPFIQALKAVENLFKDNMKVCFSSISVIFTKVPTKLNDNPVDRNLINELLSQYLSHGNMCRSRACKDFINYLINDGRNIGIFKAASVGEITEASIDDGIIEAIEKSSSVDKEVLNAVSPSISEISTVFLCEAREKLSSMQVFNELQRQVVAAFDKILNNIQRMNDGPDARREIMEFKEGLTSAKNDVAKVFGSDVKLSAKIETIQSLDPSIRSFVEDNNLLRKAQLMEFIDNLLDLEESKLFAFNLHAILITANFKCDEYLIMIQLKLGEFANNEAEVEIAQSRQAYEAEIQNFKAEIDKIKIRNESKTKSRFFANVGGMIDDIVGVIKSWTILTKLEKLEKLESSKA